MSDETRYAVGDLAELGGVTRRTVRFYVQEGLIPPPLGRGRGRHYTRTHLERLLEVRALQERGLALDEIRARLRPDTGAPLLEDVVAERSEPASSSEDSDEPALGAEARSAWTRVRIAPGLELHVSSDWRIPPPGRLARLADSCRRAFLPSSGAPQ
jgi:DNA-binding transcriptional MerR regulator